MVFASEKLPGWLHPVKARWVLPLVLILLPATVFANAGTPLMLMGLTHLFIGNAVIGFAEGLLIGLIFRVSVGWAVFSIIVANYVSMVGGYFLLSWLSVPPTIETMGTWFHSMVWIFFVLTIVIEFPFVYFALRKARRALLWAVLAVVLVNTASYAGLVAWYGRHTHFSLVSQLRIVPAAEFLLPPGLALYTISPDGAAVQRTMAGKTERIAEIPGAKDGDALVARSGGPGKFDLCLSRRDQIGDSLTRTEILLRNFSPLTPVEEERSSVQIFSESPILSFVPASDWVFFTSFWADAGLKGKNRKTGEHFHYAMETPFIAWPIYHATHLPGDLVIFELGRDQICLLDPAQKKLALTTRGSSPVVAVVPGRGE